MIAKGFFNAAATFSLDPPALGPTAFLLRLLAATFLADALARGGLAGLGG